MKRRSPPLVLLVLASLFLIPQLWLVSLALRSGAAVYEFPPRIFPAHPTLENLGFVFAKTQVPMYLWNSAKLAVLAMAATLLVGIPAAFVLSRERFKGRGAVRNGLLVVQMVSPLVLLVPIYTVITALGLLDTHAGLALTYCALQLPFTIAVLAGFFDALPDALFEAARLDGASRMRTLIQVALPILGPGLAATAIFNLAAYWSEFGLALVLLDSQQRYTVPVGLFALRAATKPSGSSCRGRPRGHPAGDDHVRVSPEVLRVGIDRGCGEGLIVDVHLVAHTHWDREWYLTREQYRFRLGELIDRVLDRMDADPRFTAFHLDGQTVVLEDYLEVRPQAEKRLRARIREGRILVGPWYVMPDMHLVSGESLVRNLALGHRLAEGFGGVMEAGYIPDPFGHVAQMPQILAGFGLDNAILWRGFGGESAECVWEGPDGTQVLLLHLPREGYCNALRLPLVAPADRPAAAARLREREADRSPSGALLLMAGVDHVEPAPGLLDLAEEIAAIPGVEGGLSTLPAYVAAVRKGLGASVPTLTLVRGELRGGESYSNLLPGVLSARTYVKQANAAVQRLIEQRAEPTSAFAWLAGGRHPGGELAYAWRTLLQNHPHDSICGCSVDEVHDECDSRYARASQAGPGRGGESPRDPCVRRRAPEGRRAAILGREHRSRTPRRVVVGTVEIPLSSRRARSGSGPGGPRAAVPAPRHRRAPREHRGSRGPRGPVPGAGGRDRLVHFMSRVEPPLAVLMRRATVALKVSVPPCGYVALDATMGAGPEPATSEAGARAPYRGLENEIYRIEVGEGATLDVHDKRTGRTWTHVAEFVDSEDMGDEYTYDPPRRDGFVWSRDSKEIRTEVVHEGPLVASLRVTFSLAVPPIRDRRPSGARFGNGRPRNVSSRDASRRVASHRVRRGRRQHRPRPSPPRLVPHRSLAGRDRPSGLGVHGGRAAGPAGRAAVVPRSSRARCSPCSRSWMQATHRAASPCWSRASANTRSPKRRPRGSP